MKEYIYIMTNGKETRHVRGPVHVPKGWRIIAVQRA